MTIRELALSLCAAGAVFAFAAPAAATVQALALVSTGQPVELACEGQNCAAEFSSFCLQPERGAPTIESRYRFAAGADVRLIGERRDGGTVALDPSELTVRAIRTHVAVALSVPRARFNELDLAKLTIAIGEDVALLPEPAAGEAPLSRGEIAAISNSLRPLGSEMIDRDGERMQAVRLMSRMINLLPRGGRESPAERASIWRAAAVSDGLEAAASSARQLIRQTHDFCADSSARIQQPSMRACLQSRHDTTMGALNDAYWEKVKNGT